MEINEVLAGLNPAQREAVETIFGPVLVIAGPGTGKTQVLASRIAYILQHPDVQITPGQILCLTFTEAGVAAMRARLNQMIGSAAYKVQIHTFHSFCNKIIQDYPDKFPRFSGNPKQASELSKLKITKSILNDLDSDKIWLLRPANSRKDQYAKDILRAIQFLKREGIQSAQLTLAADETLKGLQAEPKLNRKGEKTKDHLAAEKAQQRNLELAHIYASYESKCREQNLYDYEDMILEVVERLHKDEELAFEILEKIQFILVDEYQDTNGAQNKILEILGNLDPEQQPNIFAVGDDDQAIYSFQGANIANILFFQQQFPATKTVVLTQNYRSTQPILDLAMDTIGHNNQRLSALNPELDKHLLASSEQVEVIKPTLHHFKHSDDEIAWLVQQIQALSLAGESLKNITVLYRNHADARLLTYALTKLNIPNQLANAANLLTQQSVLKVLQLLNVVAYSELNRDHDLMQLLMQDFIQQGFGISKVEVFSFLTKFNDQVRFGNPTYPVKTLIDLAMEMPSEHGIHKVVYQITQWQSNFSNMPLTEALIVMLDESGLLGAKFAQAANPEDMEAINDFVKFVREQNLANTAMTLTELLVDLKIYQDEELSLPFHAPALSEDAVNLMTVHAAKGLEFKHVFIIKLVEKHWSNKVNRDIFKNWPPQLFAEAQESADNEEERRLFFVATTRAKVGLHFSYADTYRDENGESEKQSTIFLEELDQNSVTIDNHNSQTEEQQLIWQNLLRPTVIVKQQQDEVEQAYLKGLLTNFRLSASALNEYLECPLKFKYNRLLKIPLVPSPEIALGNALHRALELQSKQLMAGNAVDLEQTQASFTQALQQELLSRSDYDLVHTQGLQLLHNYYQEYGPTMTAPAGVEYNFGRHQILLELANQEPICLTGKIDKLEWIDQSRNAIRIVDYKTSVPKSLNAIKGETKAADRNIWQQLVFYSLMAKLDDQFKPVGKMTKYVIEQTRVDFLKPDSSGQLKQVDLEITESDEQELVQLIGETITSIRNLEFNGTEKYPLCNECEYCKRLASLAT